MGEMTPAQKTIAAFLLEHPEAPVRRSITSLAAEIGLKGGASIVRFYRMLGFSGYHDFKVTLAQETAGRAFYGAHEEISVDDPVDMVVQKIYRSAMFALEDNLATARTEQFVQARDLLLNARRILFMGYASSGAVAAYGCFRFADLGFSSHFNTDSHVNATVLAHLSEGDLVFCVSHSGETKDIVMPLRQLCNSTPVIAVTGYADSSLAKLARVAFITQTNETTYRTDAMMSRIVQMTIIDALFTVVSLAMGDAAFSELKRTRQALSAYKIT